jgi:hypothetical protein
MGLASARGSSTLDAIIYSQRQRLLIRGLLAALYTYVPAGCCYELDNSSRPRARRPAVRRASAQHAAGVVMALYSPRT